RFDTFTRTIYTQFAGRLDPGPALFLAGLLSSGALVLVVLQQMARGRAALHGTRPARRVSLQTLSPAGRVAAHAFLSILALLALVVPISTMVWWMFRGIAQGSSLLGVVPHTLRSIGISTVAAVVVGVAAIPLGVLAARHRNAATRTLEAIPWLTYSLPHLAVGLAFLVLTVRYVRPIYQTTTLLVVVYLSMFLPQALAAIESGMRRVGPALEEVSRSLGMGQWATLRRVTIPMMRRSALAGAALVFLSVVKELPATLLLRPTGFDTLPVRIWSATNEALYSQARLAALALVLVSSAPFYLFVVKAVHDCAGQRRGRHHHALRRRRGSRRVRPERPRGRHRHAARPIGDGEEHGAQDPRRVRPARLGDGGDPRAACRGPRRVRPAGAETRRCRAPGLRAVPAHGRSRQRRVRPGEIERSGSSGRRDPRGRRSQRARQEVPP